VAASKKACTNLATSSKIELDVVWGGESQEGIYASASYMNDANTHVIEYIIRNGFKKNVVSLSDFLN
jgi:hypothetical protein